MTGVMKIATTIPTSENIRLVRDFFHPLQRPIKKPIINITTKDIVKIVQFISEQAPQRFNDQVVAENDESAETEDEDYEKFDDEDVEDIAPILNKYLRPGDDTTMRRALEVVILDRKASTSYLQRRLRIGYNKAAELIEKMEERGIVGPPSGSGNKRDILVFDGMDIG